MCLTTFLSVFVTPFSPVSLDSLLVPLDFSLTLTSALICYCLCMTLAWIWIKIVDNSLNKYCFWILNLCVSEQFVTANKQQWAYDLIVCILNEFNHC